MSDEELDELVSLPEILEVLAKVDEGNQGLFLENEGAARNFAVEDQVLFVVEHDVEGEGKEATQQQNAHPRGVLNHAVLGQKEEGKQEHRED